MIVKYNYMKVKGVYMANEASVEMAYTLGEKILTACLDSNIQNI